MVDLTALVLSFAQAPIINALLNGIVGFLTDQVRDLGGKELTDRVAALRSDARFRQQIQEATERAARRWAESYPDRELVRAVAEDTRFADLPLVQQAIRQFARNPFSPVADETLRGKFGEVLPDRFEPERVERGVAEFLRILSEEFATIPALQETLRTAASLRTADHTAVLPRMEELLKRLAAGPDPTEETLRQYLQWVVDQHRYLDPRGTMQTTRQVQVPLDEIFISLQAEEEPPLSAVDRRLYEEELKALMERPDLSPEEREDLRENLLARFTAHVTGPTREPVDLTRLVREQPRLVILGDPGSGKTTLLRYLALRHARAMLRGERERTPFLKPFLPSRRRRSRRDSRAVSPAVNHRTQLQKPPSGAFG